MTKAFRLGHIFNLDCRLNYLVIYSTDQYCTTAFHVLLRESPRYGLSKLQVRLLRAVSNHLTNGAKVRNVVIARRIHCPTIIIRKFLHHIPKLFRGNFYD